MIVRKILVGQKLHPTEDRMIDVYHYEIECEKCGKVFTTFNKRRRICDNCDEKSWHYYECCHCGKKWKSKTKYNKKFFCSDECKAHYLEDYKSSSNRVYLGNHDGYFHRQIWELYYGKIPKGYDIHHVDGNHYNNKIDNLLLMEIGKHRALDLLKDQEKVMEYLNEAMEIQSHFIRRF